MPSYIHSLAIILEDLFLLIEGFQQLLRELNELPSASHLFPQPGDDTINDKALSPCPVVFRYS